MTHILHIEVCQNSDSTLSKEKVDHLIRLEIESWKTTLKLNTLLLPENFVTDVVKDHIRSIYCYYDNYEKEHSKNVVKCIRIYIYRLTMEDAALECMEHENESLAVAHHWMLPTSEFHDLWMNLYYDNNIKEKLLQFTETALLFSDKKVNPNIMNCNRVILLYGPPGTGKTSLCKALAQKMSIRMNHRYARCELVEINSHSLFSKWFSESGKLVQKLFTEIKVLLEDPSTLVCILIDEVESLAHARKACVNGTEPSDSIRVVNALLTQLDQLRSYPNVFVFTTSNVTEAIDLAFVDRADLKQFVGHPNEKAIFKIYVDCIRELMRTGLLESEEFKDLHDMETDEDERIDTMDDSDATVHVKIQYLSKISAGFSGRTLRKIPMLAYASHSHTTSKNSLRSFLKQMYLTISTQKQNELE